MIYSEASSFTIYYNDYAKDDIIHEFWMPCEYFMVGPSGTRSFFLLDLPGHVNAF